MADSDEDRRIIDYIGVGFGPSNLALAVAFDEAAPHREGLFFERSAEFDWHGGLLFSHSRLQISFLKDLVTLRNPQSPFSFLSYLKQAGRLESFANLREFHPHRTEFLDYFRWVASTFADRIRYGTRVVAVRPGRTGDFDHFIVDTEDAVTGVRRRFRARNVVAATGGTPRRFDGDETSGGRVVHAAGFLAAVPQIVPDRARPCHIMVAGDGQSAGEVALELLEAYPNVTVEILARGYSLHASDSTPFVNNIFSAAEAQQFHAAPRDRREAILDDLRSTNYGVIDGRLLERLYQIVYDAQAAGREPLRVSPFSRLDRVRDSVADGRLAALVVDRTSGDAREIACDGVILATGYQRRLDEAVFADVIPLFDVAHGSVPATSPAGRVRFQGSARAGLYLQGLAEEAHGIGDSLLSLLAFRSGAIVADIDASTPRLEGFPAVVPVKGAGAYPPDHHLESDQRLLLDLVRRHPFATLISARGTDDPVITQLPLVLRPDADGRPRLFGHLDRRNPHAALLDGRPVLAVFHAADGYISPKVYTTSQLPTWNSLSVHVRGRARVLADRESVVSGLQSISAQSEPGSDPYRLDADDPRIDLLIGGILGFEIEVVELTGRFKLSQDRNAEDCRRAAEALCRRDEGVRDMIGSALRSACPSFETASNEPVFVTPANVRKEN